MADERTGFGAGFPKDVETLYGVLSAGLITPNEFRDSLRKAYPKLDLGPNEIELNFDPSDLPFPTDDEDEEPYE